MKKSVFNNQIADIALNTTDEAIAEMANKDNPWLEKLQEEVQSLNLGDAPLEIKLDTGHTLYISKVDTAVYSGIVKNDISGETVLNFRQNTIPTLVEMLKIKGLIAEVEEPEEEEEEKEDSEDKLEEKIELLKQVLAARTGDVHIHLHKSAGHKYIKKIGTGPNARYIYPEDLAHKQKSTKETKAEEPKKETKESPEKEKPRRGVAGKLAPSEDWQLVNIMSKQAYEALGDDKEFSCEHCGKHITNIATISGPEGNFHVGEDCALTLISGGGKQKASEEIKKFSDLKKVKSSLNSELKKQFSETSQDLIEIAEKEKVSPIEVISLATETAFNKMREAREKGEGAANITSLKHIAPYIDDAVAIAKKSPNREKNYKKYLDSMKVQNKKEELKRYLEASYHKTPHIKEYVNNVLEEALGEDLKKLTPAKKEKVFMESLKAAEKEYGSYSADVLGIPAWVNYVGDFAKKIKLAKSLYETLLKGGKRAKIGEIRTWGGQRYMKHADGWVYLGGPHHGKLMGKTKGEATHKEFVDKHSAAKPEPEAKPKPDAKPESEEKPQEKSSVFKKKGLEDYKGFDIKPWSKDKWMIISQSSGKQEIVVGSLEDAKKEVDKKVEKIQQAIEKYKKEKSPKIEKEQEKQRTAQKAAEAEAARKKLTEPPRVEKVGENAYEIRWADGSRGMARFMAASEERAKELAQHYLEEHKRLQNAWKIPKRQWLKENTPPGRRLRKIERTILESQHHEIVKTAVKAGLKVPEKVLEDYPKLVNEGKPAGFDTKLNEETNMVGTVDFSKTTKALRKDLTQKLNEANKVIKAMGLKFKTPINFEASSNLKALKRVRGVHYANSKTIVLKDISSVTTTVMHEIGHAVDYAMQDKSTTPRGRQRSQGRSAEAIPPTYGLSADAKEKRTLEDQELEKKYRELYDVVTSTEYYKIPEVAADTYYKEPTEVFARAFEVYAHTIAKELADKGEISKSFLESFSPNVFKVTDEKVVEERRKVKSLHRKIKEVQAYLDSYRKRALSDIKQEARQRYKPEDPEYLNYLAEKMKTIDEKEAYGPDGKKTTIGGLEKLWRSLADEYNEIASRTQGGLFKPVPEEKQKEYASKIKELMDYILKHDEIRKAQLISKLLEFTDIIK